ncbi:LysR family transcriptional regulator [Agaribacter marinus]|uniref:LysR family transcriptional regulator n=1 Tax=Agaribacter marinus TaxID=1431249 RepID=A0AA37T1Z8_9ALTE|nr:LysR family transcriptional regulator [Agaribacter marinus]GLR70210.1 LysR family transcriptional regulator [Agaribacter marinus]
MNTKQLEYFLTTVRKQSIAAAAREMDVAQPAISQQISNLERSMGVPLLIRDFRGVSPTVAGEIFAEHAQNILSEVSIAKSKLSELSSEQKIEIKIGMMPSICNAMSMPLIDELGEDFPNISIDISTGPSYSLSGWLQANKIDIALTYEQAFSSDFMVATPLLEEFMYLVVGIDSPRTEYKSLIEKETIPFWALSEHKILIPSRRDALGKFIEKYEIDTGVKLVHDPSYTGHLMTGLRQVMMGKGLTILPSAATYHLEEKSLIKSIKIVEPEMRRRVLAITNKNHPPSKNVTNVIRVIKHIVKLLNKSGQWRGDLC